MQYNENDFYTCPYCKSAKEKETSTRIDDKKRFLRVTYNCGTEIEIHWEGTECNSKWKVICVPASQLC